MHGARDSFGDELRRALEDASAEGLSPEHLGLLAKLDTILEHWAARIDLIGFRGRDERIRRYFAEALAALPWVPREGTALDIGSGGGTPSLPLAIARPAVRWYLIEPRRKRSLFLEEAARELGLGNVRVVAERFERAPVREPADLITTRGVRMSEALLSAIHGRLRAGGRFLWFGGRNRQESTGEELSRLFGEAAVSGPWPLLGNGGSTIMIAERA